jgi:hypothetical protein
MPENSSSFRSGCFTVLGILVIGFGIVAHINQYNKNNKKIESEDFHFTYYPYEGIGYEEIINSKRAMLTQESIVDNRTNAQQEIYRQSLENQFSAKCFSTSVIWTIKVNDVREYTDISLHDYMVYATVETSSPDNNTYHQLNFYYKDGLNIQKGGIYKIKGIVGNVGTLVMPPFTIEHETYQIELKDVKLLSM